MVVFLIPIVLAVAVAVLAVPQARCPEERLENGEARTRGVLALVDQVFCQVFQEHHSATVPVLSGRRVVLSEQIMAVVGTAALLMLHT
jgi:hypothetical protein